MWQTILLSFLAGLVAGNALPHFLRGVTKQRYPNALGNGPVPNFIGGWLGLVLAALLLWWAPLESHPGLAFGFISAGVLLAGLFHAGPGAFGRREPDPAT